ncbi:MAG: SMP-30/gluconolactonase/LRE family protein [Acidobacteria bacterium]|nr:SMP-30/gluconolactonase/LRE family protein [Acidobacteriota bacterium]
MADYPTFGKLVAHDPDFEGLIDPQAKLEKVARGLCWSEGPVWSRSEDCLYFSDIPRNAILRWAEDTGLRIWMQPSGYTGVVWYSDEPGSNALTFDAEGRMTMCEHGDRRISRIERSGGKMTLADRFEGKRLNSPNDLVYKSDGSLYFSDPAYGLPGRYDDTVNRELPFCGVFRVDPATGEIALLTDEFLNPNGLAFTPDESHLLIGQSNRDNAVIKAFPVKADGSLGAGEVFFDFGEWVGKMPGIVDGFKVDAAGNVFSSGPGGVFVISAGGKLLGRIETGERTANVAWGGDGSVAYVTMHAFLCRIRTKTRAAFMP